MTKTPTPAAWQEGWWRHAHALPSPNFGPRPDGSAITLAVIHSISLPPEQYGTGCVQQLFTNQLDWQAHPYFQTIRGAEVSAHFLIERTGCLWQFVSVHQRAWHAGQSSWRGRGNCNDYSVGIELEGIEGGTFESAQYESLIALMVALKNQYPIQDIVGHEDIAPGRKIDPGSGFDWRLLRRAVCPDTPNSFL